MCRRRLFDVMSLLILPAREPGIKSRTTTGPLQRAHLITTSSSSGKVFTADATPNQRLNTTLTQATSPANVSVAGGSGSIALTVANVSSNTASAYLQAWPLGTVVPGTSNINLAPGSHISNLVLTPTRRSGSSDYLSIDRSTSTTGSTTVQLVQLGYFS